MDRKIFSIAPSFNCSLSCHGCYLTTGVTKEMRDLTKDDYYWGRAMDEAIKAGYTEFAMTLNPYPGAIEHAITLAKMAKERGFEVINVTTVYDKIFSPVADWRYRINTELESADESAVVAWMAKEFDIKIEDYSNVTQQRLERLVYEKYPIMELLQHIDIISLSIDEMRCESVNDMLEQAKNVRMILYEVGRIGPHNIHFNLNLLWTPTMFEWMEATDNYTSMLRLIGRAESVQHLIYKPLSIYPSVEWFWEKYNWIMEHRPELHICGRSDNKFVGDAALNNFLGANACPGESMFDVDPMGFVRKCPENPVAFDGSDLEKLRDLLLDGIPNCGETKCNCITPK